MPVSSAQKIGNRSYRHREAKRLARDRKIYRLLRECVRFSEKLHALAGETIEPLSVYVGKEGYQPSYGQPPALTPFPMTKQENGKPIPRWEDLSQWLKIQVVTMAYFGDFLTFNIRIHPDLEERWAPGGVARDDVRAKMVERVRKEFDTAVGRGREWFFVVEGWSKDKRASTYLHIHGGVAIHQPGDDELLEAAVARAAGYDVNRQGGNGRAVHSARFAIEQAAYATYLLKAAKKPDPRLTDRRIAMSSAITSTSRAFWEMITRNPSEWREPTRRWW